MNEDDIAAAFIAALNANSANAYDLDDAKKLPALPAAYCEVTLSRRLAGEPRVCGSAPGTTSYRALVRCIGSTVGNARETTRRVGLIEAATITVGSSTSTPIQFETAEEIGEDEGMWSGVSSYTFTF